MFHSLPGTMPTPPVVTLTLDTWPARHDQAIEVRHVASGQALLLGRHVAPERFDDDTRAIVERHEASAVQLTAEHPPGFSSVQLVIWVQDGVPRVGRPQSSQPVRVQPWGEPLRAAPLATVPLGEPLAMLTTLWLEPGNRDTRAWRWRIGVVNAFAPWPGVARGPWNTAPENELGPLTDTQLEALLMRFSDHLQFPGVRRPSPRAMSKDQHVAVTRRIGRVRQAVYQATAEDVPADHELLQTLIGHGRLRLHDVIAHGPRYGIDLTHAAPLSQRPDPRPAPRPSPHPMTRRLRGAG